MKKYSFLIAGVLFFSACNTGEKKTETVTETTTGPATPAKDKIAKVTDPVCGMEKGSDWTEYTLNGADTAWFCSPHCKETYTKNPEKYLGKKEDKKG